MFGTIILEDVQPKRYKFAGNNIRIITFKEERPRDHVGYIQVLSGQSRVLVFRFLHNDCGGETGVCRATDHIQAYLG